MDRMCSVPKVATNEELLLGVHQIKLPQVKEYEPNALPGMEDDVAVNMLQSVNPTLLESHSPRVIYGDGNCLYRAVSLSLYGTQDHHDHLRLLVAIEIAKRRQLYDSDNPACRSMVSDARALIPPYYDVLLSAARYATSAEMIHIFAVSAVIGRPLRSYYPTTGESFTHQIVGIDVRKIQDPISMMWSPLYAPKVVSKANHHHFVWLAPRSNLSSFPLPCAQNSMDEPQQRISIRQYTRKPSRSRPPQHSFPSTNTSDHNAFDISDGDVAVTLPIHESTRLSLSPFPCLQAPATPPHINMSSNNTVNVAITSPIRITSFDSFINDISDVPADVPDVQERYTRIIYITMFYLKNMYTTNTNKNLYWHSCTRYKITKDYNTAYQYKHNKDEYT